MFLSPVPHPAHRAGPQWVTLQGRAIVVPLSITRRPANTPPAAAAATSRHRPHTCRVARHAQPTRSRSASRRLPCVPGRRRVGRNQLKYVTLYHPLCDFYGAR